jgi:penicillin-binding protein 1A
VKREVAIVASAAGPVTIINRRRGGLWWRVPIVAIVWPAFALPIVAALIVATTLRHWARDLPDVPDLAAWRADAHQTTLVLAADGTHLAELPFRDGRVVGHRTLAPLEALPKNLVLAVLAAEDVHFLEHKGVDYAAIARAGWLDYQAGRVVEGASTITQQVARNLLPEDIGTARTLKRKVREALLARALEKRWSKRDVLETYLDFVFLGQGAYGVVAGARAYFDKDVGALDLPESALLAGLIQAPGRLDPFHHPDRAKARRDEVLARMARAHLIDDVTFAKATLAPIALKKPQRSYGTVVPWYAEEVRKLLHDRYAADLARGGLTVETAALPALGSDLAHAARAHAAGWKQHNLTPEIGALLLDHRTGYIEALLGGLQWSKTHDQFDRVTQSCRQPGSAWKPLVYGAALDANAITPGTPLRDAPIAEYDDATRTSWKPRSSGHFLGIVLAQDAFASSLNAPAIDVFDRVGGRAIIALARKLGITSKLDNVRPLALGASCVKPIELARVFAIIARRGWAVQAKLMVRVRRGDQLVFDDAVPEDPELDAARRYDRIAATAGADPAARIGARDGRLMDERVAFQLEDMMSAVVERGTAASASSLGRPAAGKTGTTNDNTDAWFVGFTGRELGAVWIGFDDPRTKLGERGDGAHAALPLWMRAIALAEGARPSAAVPGDPPAGLVRATIDRETGLLAAPHAGGVALWFRDGTAPTEVSGQPGSSPSDFDSTAREF